MRVQRAKIVSDRSNPTPCLSTTVPRATYDAFEQLARADGMSKSAKLRWLIEGYVEEPEVEKA